ncbi:MAG TPA: hypothetical protein VE974_15500 [Thermoanaerobaculia bacterium]|nr:hypothetical protein [Thermoanaerobaculia bacterium]
MNRGIASAVVAIAFAMAAACADVPAQAVPADVVIQTRGGPVPAEVRLTEVALPGNRTRDARGVLAVVREPSSGLHWWCVIDGPPTRPPSIGTVRRIITEQTRFVVDATSIVGFWSHDVWLNVRDVSATSSSLDAAVAQALASPDLEAIRAGAGAQWRQIPVGLALPRSFVRPDSGRQVEDASPRAARLSFGEITRENRRWYVTLKNERGRSKVVVLSDRFELLSPRRGR